LTFWPPPLEIGRDIAEDRRSIGQETAHEESHRHGIHVARWGDRGAASGRIAMTHAAQVVLGASLIAVPTIVYGGLTVLGVASGGAYGAPAPTGLTPLQQSLYRAGHAHGRRCGPPFVMTEVGNAPRS